MHINGVEVEDTFAEAFKMWGARLIITAVDRKWARIAAENATGFATSIIACGAEAGIEGDIPASETPDGRPGVSVLVFTMGPKGMREQLMNRVGQCVMTCATTACFNGLRGGERALKIGGQLRYFGDGFQISKLLEGRRLWRIPVMEGEFLVDERFQIQRAVGGGNFLILGENRAAALEAAEAAVRAISEVDGVATPFPGGVVRSGSKTTSKYRFLRASTNSPYCPTLRGQVETALPAGVNSVLEIVIDGLSEEAVREAMRVGIEAACRPGVVRISAGNYGGTLGRYQFYLHDVLGKSASNFELEAHRPADSKLETCDGDAVTLRLKESTPIPIEADSIRPDNFIGRSQAEIEGLPAFYGRRRVTLGDLFSVEGEGSANIVLEGDLSHVKRIGQKMSRGRVTIHSDVGPHLGSEMSGGEIVVHGDVGAWAGAQMSDGRIWVHGDAGPMLGAAYTGERLGMRGGVIIVDGSAGPRAAERMRRGIIIVQGDLGDFAGARMIAGSLFTFGKLGARPGAGMKRGTILTLGGLADQSRGVLPTFRYSCLYESPTFLRYYLRRLRDWGLPVKQEHVEGRFHRYTGDITTVGKGEILIYNRRSDR